MVRIVLALTGNPNWAFPKVVFQDVYVTWFKTLVAS
jgi:hypothetical protein